MEWACALVDLIVGRSVENAACQITDGGHDSDVSKVKDFIRGKGTCTLSELTRKFQGIKRKDRDDILRQLQDAELIDVTQTRSKGPPKLTITYLE